MMSRLEVDLVDAKKLAIAFQEIEARISKKQLEDLRQLYECTKGIPYTLDSKNRPQGPTIHTCKTVGSLIKKQLGDGPIYGMSWIGYINNLDNWAMRENIRAALGLLGWFGPIRNDMFASTSPLAENATLVNASSIPPQGRRHPQKRIEESTVYVRDDDVRNWVLRNSNWHCECCKQRAPFELSDGLPYLEVHHVRHLANDGSDTVSNAVALCPNCHREMHHGKHKDELADNLYACISRLKRE